MTTAKKLLATLALVGASTGAMANDIGLAEVARLVEAGTIQAPAALDKAALAKHPGATIHGSDLEDRRGRLVYEVELRDEAGVEWDVELDAKTAEVLSSVQDD